MSKSDFDGEQKNRKVRTLLLTLFLDILVECSMAISSEARELRLMFSGEGSFSLLHPLLSLIIKLKFLECPKECK